MIFHWSHVLWLLAIPALWLALDLLRNQKITTAAAPSKIIHAEATRTALRLSPQTPRPSPSSKPRWRFCLGLAFALVALARPQWGRLEEPIFDQSREILLALDLSKSMNAPDVKPSRLDRAKLLITSLLDRLEGERVGLVVFSGTAFLQSPLSADYEILRELLPEMKPGFLPQGGSNYRDLLEAALGAFGTSSSADRYLIILSDGEATDDNWKPLVEELKKKGIHVIGLGVGTAEGAMIPETGGSFVKDERGAVVMSKLESRTLRELAEATGGLYTDASTWVDLAQLINKTVETGRKGAFMERNRVRLAERFQWALAPALLFFAWSFWREFPVRPRTRDIALKPSQPSSLPPPLPSRNRPTALSTTTTALLALLWLLSPFTLHSSLLGASAADAPPPAGETDPVASISQPLSTLVGHFSTEETLSARDYAEIARTTVTYGERLESAKQPVPEGPIRDALLAVDRGQSLDAAAADWADLRTKLEKFLKKPEQPPQPDKDKKQDDKKDKQDKKDQQQDSKNQSGGNDQKSDSQKSDDQKKQDGQKPGDDSKKEGQPQSSDQQQQQQQPPQQSGPGSEKNDPSKNQQSAFGDMKKPGDDQKTPDSANAGPPPSDSTPPGETQKFGGASEGKSSQPVDPNLALQLQKLDQVRSKDSPAQLFQLLQDPKSKPAPAGKDW